MNVRRYNSIVIKSLAKYFLFIASFFTFSFSTLAQATTGNSNVSNPIGLQNLAELVNNLTIFIIPTAIVGFVFCVLYAGYVRLFAAGESGLEKKSMSVAKSAAIGFAVIFLANVALYLVINVFKLNA